MNLLLKTVLGIFGAAFEELMLSTHAGARFGRWLFTRKIVIIWVTTGLVIFLGFFTIAFIGPHMKYQQHIITYETPATAPPSGAVPVEKVPLWPDSVVQKNKDKLSTVKDGKILYTYYCAFCHGNNGSSPGPVGESFVPTPTILTTARVQSMSDSMLLGRMIIGVGHQKFIDRLVAPQNRNAIAAYVKTLKESNR